MASQGLKLFLHDLEVTNLRTSTFGIFVDAVEFGETFCVFKASDAKLCISTEPKPQTDSRCPRCDWRKIKEVIHL